MLLIKEASVKCGTGRVIGVEFTRTEFAEDITDRALSSLGRIVIFGFVRGLLESRFEEIIVSEEA